MPLYKTIHISNDVVLYIWKISETESELRQNISLTNSNEDRVKGMKSGIHRRGFLSIRHLMLLEGYQDKDLYYDQLGKPHLHNGQYISITHSYEFTGIILSRREKVGIDIEKQRDKIIRIAHKFTTLNTKDYRQNTPEIVRKLTLLWGAKESIYKISAIEGLSFLQNIYLEPGFAGKEWFKGVVNYGDQENFYRVSHIEFEGFTCVYALKE